VNSGTAAGSVRDFAGTLLSDGAVVAGRFSPSVGAVVAGRSASSKEKEASPLPQAASVPASRKDNKIATVFFIFFLGI
jgi:hypothetical protein